MNFPEKLLELLANPDVAIPFWGAMGGAIKVLFQRPFFWLRSLLCVWLGSVFAYLFTSPTLYFFGVDERASAGVAALLGILSYELASGLTQLKWHQIAQALRTLRGK